MMQVTRGRSPSFTLSRMPWRHCRRQDVSRHGLPHPNPVHGSAHDSAYQPTATIRHIIYLFCGGWGEGGFIWGSRAEKRNISFQRSIVFWSLWRRGVSVLVITPCFELISSHGLPHPNPVHGSAHDSAYQPTATIRHIIYLFCGGGARGGSFGVRGRRNATYHSKGRSCLGVCGVEGLAS